MIIFLTGIRIVRPTHGDLIERFGRYKKPRYFRFHWIIPVVDRIFMVNITEQMVDAELQGINTNDNLDAGVDAQVYLRVKSESIFCRKRTIVA
ncbi:MAG: hypothetical protein PWR04_1403 [Anaerophaga sp.]|nr:hypothetical protein [Anaerophaga sp.]